MTVVYRDTGSLPADDYTFNEALAYARGKAHEAQRETGGTTSNMEVQAIGVELTTHQWSWWYKLGTKKRII
jgi:hypothetical protein